MKMTLANLSEQTEEKYGMKIVAGREGVNHIVRWVHIIEDMEVPEFLHGNELIFTTGIARHQMNWLLHFVKSLRENNAAGLVVNLGPYIEGVPPQVLIYCEQHDFPLYTIPWKTRIIDVTYEFCRQIIQNDGAEQSLADAFKNLILNPQGQDNYEFAINRLGFSKESKYRLLLIDCMKTNQSITEQFLRDKETEFTKVFEQNHMQKGMFLWRGKIVLIYQNLEEYQLHELLQGIKNLGQDEGIKNYVGISEEYDSYIRMSEMYDQAESANRIAKIQNETWKKYEEIGIYKILLNVENQDLLKCYYNEVIGELVEYDQKHHSELCGMLKLYCMTNGSVNVIAEHYGLHRNTINYKINKIKRILKVELNMVEMMYILLSFNIKELID